MKMSSEDMKRIRPQQQCAWDSVLEPLCVQPEMHTRKKVQNKTLHLKKEKKKKGIFKPRSLHATAVEEGHISLKLKREKAS